MTASAATAAPARHCVGFTERVRISTGLAEGGYGAVLIGSSALSLNDRFEEEAPEPLEAGAGVEG